MSKCKCGSYAINHRSHGRVAEKHSDLCDVCYWRAEAAQARADALDWFESLLTPFDPVDPHCTCDKCIVVRRLRALIAAERGEVEG